jgi:hypothetical protein
MIFGVSSAKFAEDSGNRGEKTKFNDVGLYGYIILAKEYSDLKKIS